MQTETDTAVRLAEIQGLYGAFTFSEKLLQRIWLRGDFNRSAAVTTTGRRVRILHPGKWNLLGGPDFHGARLRFDEEEEITGDIELHLRAGDWDAHGHAGDPAYGRVILHVVLFPPEPLRVTRGGGGAEIPVLALLPLLHHDLEEFAADEAVETLANRAAARIPDELGLLSAAELAELLQRHAEARWRQKVHFARLRLQRLGWESALHQGALEVLGYRFNRAPMLRVAGEWPLTAWRAGPNLEEIYSSQREGWSLQGVRPANQPRARLRQYASWVAARPDWPTAWRGLGSGLPQLEDGIQSCDTRAIRRTCELGRWRDRIRAEICGDAVGGTRFETLMCDCLLPLLAAESGGERVGEGLWRHWFVGDLPPILTRGLRLLGVFDGKSSPACHGVAQGLLGWLLAREARS